MPPTESPSMSRSLFRPTRHLSEGITAHAAPVSLRPATALARTERHRALWAGVLAASLNSTATFAQGLIDEPGAELVTAHCSACHSLELVTQNRGDRAHWLKVIRWMQDKQNLWDLGPAEDPILDYLATHYGVPEQTPRRQPLVIQWRSSTSDSTSKKP